MLWPIDVVLVNLIAQIKDMLRLKLQYLRPKTTEVPPQVFERADNRAILSWNRITLVFDLQGNTPMMLR